MRTTCAHYGRSGRNDFIKRCSRLHVPAQLLFYQVLAKLPDIGEQVFAGHLKPQIPAVGFDKAIQLLHHHKFLDHSRKVFDLLLRHGPDHTQFQYRVGVSKCFFHILVTGGRSDDTTGFVAAFLDPVDLSRFRPCRQRFRARLHLRVTFLGIGRHHDVFPGIFLIFSLCRQHPLSCLHHTLRMTDASTHLKQHCRIVCFRQLISQLRKADRFRRIRWLQHGNLRRLRVMS